MIYRRGYQSSIMGFIKYSPGILIIGAHLSAIAQARTDDLKVSLGEKYLAWINSRVLRIFLKLFTVKRVHFPKNSVLSTVLRIRVYIVIIKNYATDKYRSISA